MAEESEPKKPPVKAYKPKPGEIRKEQLKGGKQRGEKHPAPKPSPKPPDPTKSIKALRAKYGKRLQKSKKLSKTCLTGKCKCDACTH